jgi:hypothetical protein
MMHAWRSTGAALCALAAMTFAAPALAQTTKRISPATSPPASSAPAQGDVDIAYGA